MKKFICMLISITIMFSLSTAVFANDGGSTAVTGETPTPVENPVILDFKYYSYTMDHLSQEDAIVVKTKDDAEGIEYKIYDKNHPEFVDVARVDFQDAAPATRAANTRSTFFSKYKTIKNTKTNKEIVKLQYKVRVDLYESGSFKSFYGADSSNLLIASAITSFELLNKVTGVKSACGSWPCSSLTYNYSANLRTTIAHSTSSTIGVNLAGAGFSVTSSTGSNYYYYRIVSETGTINLYN